MHRDDDPKMKLRRIAAAKYDVMTWTSVRNDNESGLRNVDTTVSAGDGLDPSVLSGDLEGRTANYYLAADHEVVEASGAGVQGRTVIWRFARSDKYQIGARIDLPEGDGPPTLRFDFRPAEAGWYSVGYAGAPSTDIDAIDGLWQPLIWQEKRIPEVPYLTLAFRCTLPTTLVTRDGVTVGVVADSKELPFQPLPRPENSGFGVMVRNEKGYAQPLIFAPVLGSEESKLEKGQLCRFSANLVVVHGGVNDAYEYIARSLFKFRDFRTQTTFSLNDTLNNMVEYGMSKYSRFNEDQRGCAYITDVPGAVKNVSSLHPLSVAFIMDDPDIYTKRARPIIEYLMSREKFLFALDPNQTIQSPSWRLLGPCAPVEEMAALYAISHDHSDVFLHFAEETIDKKRTLNLDDRDVPRSWPKLLALYQATGDQKLLEEAVRGADAYLQARVNTSQHDYSDPYASGMFFWTSYAPLFIELTELYEETGQRRFLDAAVDSAHRFTQFIWMCPEVPDQDVLVNKGGKAPQYWYLKSKGHLQMNAPEHAVPAWELSEIGLTCESSGTSAGHRAIFPATYAPVMLRLSAYTNDQYLHDIARSAIIGRYENFPGYHMNTARTDVFMGREYPLHEHEELSYNSFHYNHVWPHIALLYDYLISDVFYRSQQQIHFPSQYTPGYAYLKGKIYGDKPGEFYGDKDVWLWMPKGLLDVDNPRVNYLTAEGNNRLYVALTNQSPTSQKVTLKINEQLAGLKPGGELSASVWYDNQSPETIAVQGGAITLDVSPNGITALAIDGVSIHREFTPYKNMTGKAGESYLAMDFCGTRAMLIDMAQGYRSGYVYLQETFEKVESTRLHYQVNGKWLTKEDSQYPYEFTVELDDSGEPFKFYVEVKYKDGTTEKSPTGQLGPS